MNCPRQQYQLLFQIYCINTVTSGSSDDIRNNDAVEFHGFSRLSNIGVGVSKSSVPSGGKQTWGEAGNFYKRFESFYTLAKLIS